MAIDQKMTDDHVGSICGFTPSLYIRQRLLKMSLEVFYPPHYIYDMGFRECHWDFTNTTIPLAEEGAALCL